MGRFPEEGKTTHSSILAWRILYSPWGHKELDTTEWLSLHFTSLHFVCYLFLFSCCFQYFFFIFNFCNSDYNVSWSVPLWVNPLWDNILPGLGWLFLFQVGEFLSFSVFKYFFRPFLSSPSETSIIQIWECLMLSQRSLKISSFLFTYLFFCSVGVSSTMLSTISLIFLVYNLVYYWFLLVFFISVIVFFISVLLLFILSNSLLKNSNFSLCTYSFFPSFWSSLQLLPWTLSLENCLSLLHLVLLGFYLIPLYRACSSSHLILSKLLLYFYACGSLVTFLSLREEAFCRRHSVHPSSAHSFHHPHYMFWGFPIRELCGSFCCCKLIMWAVCRLA